MRYKRFFPCKQKDVYGKWLCEVYWTKANGNKAQIYNAYMLTV